MAASLDFDGLRRAVRAAIAAIRPGRAPPATPGVSEEQLKDVSGLIWRVFKEEYQLHAIGKIAASYDETKTRPVPGCVLRESGPFRKIGEGSYGAVWVTGDRRRAIKVGEVALAEKEGHAVLEQMEAARHEFAIARLAGELGVGPVVYDAYFCCSVQSTCHYVIVMDALPGRSLTQWLASAGVGRREAMRKQVLDLVAKLSGAGVEHTDLHSDNVIVLPDDRAFIIDYGLATWTGTDRRADVEAVNRTFSETFTLEETARHVAAVLVAKGAIKLNSIPAADD